MKLKRFLPLSLLLQCQGFAIELTTIEKTMTENGYKSNYSRLADDNYYGARKHYGFDAEFGVEVFFRSKVSQQISQIRFRALRCKTAKMPESEFRSMVQNDYLAAYKRIFQSTPPQKFSDFFLNKNETVKADSQSYRSVVFRTGTPKCDGNEGTISSLNFNY